MTADRDPLFDLTGKVALVTGGSRGLGYQMVKAFAERGADVIIASRKLENCEAVAEEVRALGRKALGDGGPRRQVARDRPADRAGLRRVRPDRHPGQQRRDEPAACPATRSPRQLFNSVVNLNFKGPFRLASQVAKRMADGDGGCIINVSSTGSMMPLPQTSSPTARRRRRSTR